MRTSSPRPRQFVCPIMVGLMAGALMVLAPLAARAQTPAPARGKWTFEIYGGGSAGSESRSGNATAEFPAGTPFTLESGAPSRAVPSWYFGDGALLFNQVAGEFALLERTPFARITPLDAALTAGGASRGSGGIFGVRVGRALSQRFALEVNVERGLARLKLSDSMRNALEQTSDSFTMAFQDLLETAPVTNLSTTSNLTLRDLPNSQTRVAGALTWMVVTGRGMTAYVTGGVGVVINSGDAPQAILNGNYTFRHRGLFPMNETDRVVVKLEQPRNGALGLVGGGVTYDLSSRTGLRADVRLALHSSKVTTIITASPNVLAQSPTSALPSFTSPGIQFSTQPGVSSSLSGADTNLTTFTGSGLSRQVSVTIGFFRRC